MKKRFATVIIIFAILSTSVPVSLLVNPPRAQASYITLDLPVGVTSALSSVYNAITEAGVWAQKALQYLFYLNEYVLQPLAFIESGKSIQAITGGMLSFVSGASNGTGQKQFATNLLGQLQGVGNNQALAFTSQLRKNIGGPFAGVISSSLRQNYLQQSSLAGFFAQNQCTLQNYTRGNPEAFLAGNWSQGGLTAWMALTTQPQNNPYLLYDRANRQLGLLSANAQASTKAQLDWGKGIMSWCGSTDSPPGEGDACDAGDGNVGTWKDDICFQNTAGNAEKLPVSPGSPCANKDGTPGEIKTPGSVITGYLDKSLGLNADKINKLGDAATQITSLVAGIMQTVQLAQDVIGGSGSNPGGGLAGVGDTYTDALGNPVSTLGKYGSFTQPTTGYAGVNTCAINQSLLEQTPSDGSELLGRVDQYVTAWSTIGTAAKLASTTLDSLITYCDTNKATYPNNLVLGTRAGLVINEANYALYDMTGELGTRISVRTALRIAAESADVKSDAEALIASVTAAIQDPTAVGGTCVNPISELKKLEEATPTIKDLEGALYNARPTSNATSTIITQLGSAVSLHVSKGTFVDQMKMLTENATELRRYCTP